MDPKGETQPYYEFEMNALNATWDLRLDKPYMDGGKPHNEWEMPGMKTAVAVNGTLNNPSDLDSRLDRGTGVPMESVGPGRPSRRPSN